MDARTFLFFLWTLTTPCTAPVDEMDKIMDDPGADKVLVVSVQKFYAAVIAWDLFVNPAGIQFLAHTWFMTFAGRALLNLPHLTFGRLLKNISSLRAKDDFRLDLIYPPLERRLDLVVLRVFRDDVWLSFSWQTLKDAGRERTQWAIGQLLKETESPWGMEGLSGTSGELWLGAFFATDVFASIFNRAYVTLWLMREWLLAFKTSWAVVQEVDVVLWEQWQMEIAQVLGHCHYDALAAQVQEMVRARSIRVDWVEEGLAERINSWMKPPRIELMKEWLRMDM